MHKSTELILGITLQTNTLTEDSVSLQGKLFFQQKLGGINDVIIKPSITQ